MPLTDYSDFEKEIRDAEEPKVLPRGTEAQLRIIAVRTGVSESDKHFGVHYVQIVFDVPKEPMCKEFNEFMWDLADRSKLSDKEVARTKDQFKKFAACFGLDYSRPFNWEDLIGKLGWAILGVQKDDQYGDKNSVSKYVTGPGQSKPTSTSAPNGAPY